MILDDPNLPRPEPRLAKLITPFLVISVIIFVLSGVLILIEYTAEEPIPHGFGRMFAVMGFGTAIFLFALDRLMIEKLSPRAVWLIEAALLVGLYLFVGSGPVPWFS
ncbi:hypothetical protein [Lewinella sp. W8]|uniref:hypothetical protein n=1 Tax=Lewinella sp. W8 TaxID=2528208 RepID=UPI001068C0B1|nr:hypothetical protein [Lewinella sp. W8]MTB51132.1 hypothetical protein [Lewinella sp. W8]